jgi:hypothetical protein
MSTPAYYHPGRTDIDLSDAPKQLYDEIISWHGRIAPPRASPVFTCLGNGKPLYVVHHQSGRITSGRCLEWRYIARNVANTTG